MMGNFLRNLLILGLVFITALMTGCASEESYQEEVNDYLTGKQILMVIAPGNFRDEELLIPREVFEQHGADVNLACSKTGQFKGMFGAVANVEILLSDVNPADYDAVIFVGGSGAKLYWDEPQAHELARKFDQEVKLIGAICIAPVILDRAGILEGKEATVFSSATPQIKTARLKDANVVVDGRVVTGNGPEAAEKFAKAIVDLLK